MRVFAALALSLIILSAVAVPAVALADPLAGALVEDCKEIDRYAQRDGGNFSGACQLCDLVDLAYNLIYFGVAFTVIVATIMFTYAGILYFTAAAKPENIKKAHGIFVKTLVGMIIVFSAFLIVDLIMKTLLNDRSLGFWTRPIACVDYPKTTSLSTAREPSQQLTGGSPGGGGGRGGGGAGVTYNGAEEAAARQRLQGKVNINNCPNEAQITDIQTATDQNGCDVCDEAGETRGCTNVGGLQEPMISFLERLSASWRDQCTLTVTGGSEAGHEEHNNGYAFDLRTGCAPLEARIAELPNGVDTANQIRWIRESSPDHWHVCHTSQPWCVD